MPPFSVDGPSSPSRATSVRPGVPTPSPSGAYVLELVERREETLGRSWSYLHVRVLTPPGELLYEAPERFAAWFPIFVVWDTMNRVWLRSGDVGVRVWQAEPGGWKGYVWQSGGPSVPDSSRTIWDAEQKVDVPIIGWPLPPGLGSR